MFPNCIMMIKKVLFPFFALPFFIALSSCEDSLTLLPPDGQVKAEYWQKKEDVKAILMGAYQKFANMDEHLFYLGELRGDLLIDNYNLSNEKRDLMNSNIYPWNTLTDWKSFYCVINYCNTVLKYSPQVKRVDGTFSDYKYYGYNAEAVFLRSLAYFYLVRVWNNVPFILTPYDSDNQDFFPKQTDSGVILDSLHVQLNRILKVIPESYDTDDKNRGRATRGAVYALLADISLWDFDYQHCIEYVDNIKQNELYGLMPGGEWFTIFSRGNTLEGIFELQFDSQLGQSNHLYDVTKLQSHNFLASVYSMDLFSPEISKEVFRGEGSIRVADQIIWKYVGQRPDGLSFRSASERRNCNWIVYRLADVLLLKAEALTQTGRYSEALSIINEIRERALVKPVEFCEENPHAFEDLILKERATELAFEGKRWFDLLRMGRRNNFERKAKLIEIIINNAPATQKRVLASKLNDINGWYFPIFEGEMENNLNLVQNPYYQVYED